MPENAKKPQIRFKGFTDDWEQRKVTELGKIYIGLVTTMTKHYTSKGTLLIRNSDIKDGRFEFGEEPIYLDEYFAKENLLRMHKIGDVITVHTGDVGTSAVIGEKEENSIGFATIVTRPNSQIIDSNYLSTFLNTDKHKKWAVAISTGDGRTNYNLGDYYKLTIPLPILQEQKAIATFITKINNLITLHQRKLEKLKNIKKSMLEKMFPKNGSNIPGIRFKGFTDAWEQRKVSELLVERNEQAPMSEEYPLMAFIANEGVTPKGERYDRSSLVTDTENKLYKRTEFGDFIYSSNNLETGSIGLNKYGKACISPVYSIFLPTGIANSDFLGRRLVRKDFINLMVKWRQGVIYGQWKIHESDFLKIEISVPLVKEQCKIGAFLDNLDNLITLHQRKLEKLQNIKKACLEKMFV